MFDDMGVTPAQISMMDQAESIASERLNMLIEHYRGDGKEVPIPLAAYFMLYAIDESSNPQESLVLQCYILAKAIERLAKLPQEEFEL